MTQDRVYRTDVDEPARTCSQVVGVSVRAAPARKTDDPRSSATATRSQWTGSAATAESASADHTAAAGGAQGLPSSRGGQPAARRAALATVQVHARGEDFRIVQLQGQLFVCTRQHGSCCCGWEEKGRMPFDPDSLWGREWERRKIRNRVHLTFTGCLGPCAAGNNALLQLHGRSIWLKDLNRPELASGVYDWIEAMLAAGTVLPVPDPLREHVYERFAAPPGGAWTPLGGVNVESDGLERLDPVCLMEVDPATAKHTVDHGGRTIAFCAPSCKRQFLADPEAYLVS